jgi:hypothetical protein
MTEFIQALSIKYQLPQDKMSMLVDEVVNRIESDLPQNCNQQINEEMIETISMGALRRTSVFAIP